MWFCGSVVCGFRMLPFTLSKTERVCYKNIDVCKMTTLPILSSELLERTTQIIPGLLMIPKAISAEIESYLINSVYLSSNTWQTTVSGSSPDARRIQQYGCEYDYRTKRCVFGTVPTIPDWTMLAWNEIMANDDARNLIHSVWPIALPQQVIVNEYVPPEGIAAHFDSLVFRDGIVSLSLGSGTGFVFRSHTTGVVASIYVPRRTLLVMTGESRYSYTHEIPKRLKDPGYGSRDVRISLTFRQVKD